MKIKYITHACLLVETNNCKILTDPWLVGPSWGGTLWHFPTHNFTPKNLPEKPSAIPRSINRVLSKLLPSNSKKIAKNKAMMETRIERMRFSMNF